MGATPARFGVATESRRQLSSGGSKILAQHFIQSLQTDGDFGMPNHILGTPCNCAFNAAGTVVARAARRGMVILLLVGLIPIAAAGQDQDEEERPRIEPDGTVQVSAFDLPVSGYLSEESRAAMQYFYKEYAPEFGKFSAGCPNLFELNGDVDAIREARNCIAKGYYKTSIYKDTLAKHPVDISVETIAGVYTEVFVPQAGIKPQNKNRILICIHGGGFVAGSRYFSHTESIQVAEMGGFKVVSPDYRMAPEYAHPAGVEDVIAVYRKLLEDYQPNQVGIYGCSAGAMLTAQAVAYMHQHEIPKPGAVGMSCAAAPVTAGDTPGVFATGESSYVSSAISGFVRPVRRDANPRPRGYFRDVKANDPIVAPGDHDDVMAAFPPTLLFSGTRDFAMSSVIATHSQLTRLGVEADLHIWEGMGHATFAFNPRLPESDEVHNVMVRFFDKHLAK